MLLFSIITYAAKAQVTGAGIRGTVTVLSGEPQGKVSIQATHLSSGSVYNTTTQTGGSYTVPNMRSGGPYNIIFTAIGFAPDTITDVTLTLGNFSVFDITLMPTAQMLQGVFVSGNGNTIRKIGTRTTIVKEQLEQLPTLTRSLQDFIRLSPQANGNSLAGTNFRYNNLSIDGASLNDAFGFTESISGAGGSQATGTPGSLAKTQPISLEAIQEVQVEVSPYTTTIGNFTGGSINAVTRSGTNNLSASVFFSGRNKRLTGKSADAQRTPSENFNDYQTGFRLGGAFIKNKLFYFTAFEIGRREQPVPSAPGSTESAIPFAIAKGLYDTVSRRFGYDLGTFGTESLQTNSNKFFGRLDWNLNSIHKLSLRTNYIDAFSDNLERNTNVLNFGSQGFRHNSRTLSTVFEAKSNFSPRLSNNLIVGFTTVKDHRDPKGAFFPHIEITYNTANTIYLGAYREAAVYGLRTKALELTDNLVFYRNKHTITLGTHNEFHNIDYRFLTAFNGRWAYRSVDDFNAQRPSRIRGVYNLTNNDYNFNRENPSAKFRVYLLSQYLQDEVSVYKNFRLTVGVRLDYTVYPDREPVAASIQATKGFENFKNITSNAPQIAPRIGFNWNVTENRQVTIRGGAGIFNGRMPFAWLAYPYYNNGSKYGNIDIRPTGVVPLQTNVATVAAQYQPNIREINLLDNNFKLPQVWRSSLAVDYKTNNGWNFTLEGIYTKTIHDVLFKTVNLKDSTAALKGTGDNRPVYLGNNNGQKINASFTNVFLLTNTSEGYRYQLTASVSKKVKDLSFTTAYTYGVSKDISNGVRVSPQANWEFNQTIHANSPQLAFSNFDLRHRSITSLQYAHTWKKGSTTISLVYNAQSGSPYTYTYIGDINRDGSPNNDLVFIPRSRQESNLEDIRDANNNIILSAATQWEQLNQFIEGDRYLRKHRGNYAERNGARTPWNQQLDSKIVHTMALGKEATSHSLSIALDVFNLSNLISRNWGKQYFVPNILNSSYQLLTVRRANTSTPPELSFSVPTTTPWLYDPLLSRTQGLLTVRYSL